MEAKKSDYGTSGNSSSLQIETPPVISPTLTPKPTGTDNSSQFWIYSNFISCLIVGPLNFVSYKVMYAAYGESRAFFVSQGVNFLYVLYGGIILHYLTKKGEITEEMRAIPHLKFIVMGFLDCLGGFLAAMGANRTPGSLQQLLNQTLIPIIMFMSWFFLGKTSTYLQLIGASVILFGACVVIFPSTSEDENGSRTLTSTYDIISYLLYFSSNIPIAFSCIYKEMGFRNLQVHVMYMTQLVSIYQLLWGFVLGVLQMMPGIGSETGYSLSEINSSFWSGVLCFLEMDQECRERGTFLLLTGYCIINFVFNILGLYLVKNDGAILSTLTNALLLPLTMLSFNLSFLGPYKEKFNPMSLVGLGAVLLGFSLWRLKHIPCIEKQPEVEDEEDAKSLLSSHSPPKPLSPVITCGVVYEPRSRSNSLDSLYGNAPDAFYDRVIVLSLDA